MDAARMPPEARQVFLARPRGNSTMQHADAAALITASLPHQRRHTTGATKISRGVGLKFPRRVAAAACSFSTDGRLSISSKPSDKMLYLLNRISCRSEPTFHRSSVTYLLFFYPLYLSPRYWDRRRCTPEAISRDMMRGAARDRPVAAMIGHALLVVRLDGIPAAAGAARCAMRDAAALPLLPRI